MKRSTARWTTAIAAAALLLFPASGIAQTATPPQTAPAAAAQNEQPAAPQEHLRKAEEALNSIPVASVSAPMKARIAELKQRLTKLERAAANPQDAAGATAKASADVKWDAEVAAIDRTLTQMLGADAGAPVGTSGKASAAAALDPEVHSKLTEFRTHITAFAAAMGAGAAGAAPSSSAEPPATSAAQPPASAATQPPATSATQPPSTATAQPPAGAQPPETAAPGHVDAEAAKRHLTAARNSLSEMTQLPAAAQLTGDARAQVTQLISNFNELITTNAEWRASYAKVAANLDALLGPDGTDEPPRTATSGTTGAVGTSGATSSVDPAIRAKLVEFRNHLDKFVEAAGDKSSDAPAPASASEPPASSAAASSSMTQSSSSMTHSSDLDKEAVLRHIQAIETILQSAGTAGTSATGTAGTTGSTQSGVTLTAAQAEQLRTHLSELKRMISPR